MPDSLPSRRRRSRRAMVAAGRRCRPRIEPLEWRRLLATVSNIQDDGPGSLRRAIEEATSSVGPHLIDFAIPGAGVHTIRPRSPLPIVPDDTIIDGWSQGGDTYMGPPLIELDGE